MVHIGHLLGDAILFCYLLSLMSKVILCNMKKVKESHKDDDKKKDKNQLKTGKGVGARLKTYKFDSPFILPS